jgi:hypothetical protein
VLTVASAGALQGGRADAQLVGGLLQPHAKVGLQVLQPQLLSWLARVAAALAPPPPRTCILAGARVTVTLSRYRARLDARGRCHAI